MVDLSHIKGVVWDLDGTLYRYNDYFIEACNVACAQTIVELGHDMSYEEALETARKSEKTSGNSFKLFGAMGIKYEDYHTPFHAKIDHLIVEKNNELSETLSCIQIPMTVLTNASRDWAIRTLAHIGMLDVFGEDKILALEDVGFKAKAYHTNGFDEALLRMGIKPHETLMVEDLSKNLVVAKQMGMTTALVHHQNENQEQESHIDHVFEDTLDVVKILANI